MGISVPKCSTAYKKQCNPVQRQQCNQVYKNECTTQYQQQCSQKYKEEVEYYTKQNVIQTTKRTANINGKALETIRCGHPFLEHVTIMPMTSVEMFRNRNSSKFHTMTVRTFQNRFAIKSQNKNAAQ